MQTVRHCGCKGIRTCLSCEKEYNIPKPDYIKSRDGPSYVYCPECELCWPGWDMEVLKQHPNHNGEPIRYDGVYIQLDFLNDDEAKRLMTALDDLPWETSQSGRRKQNYGPKTNFKKQRLRPGPFNGFPESTKFVQEKLIEIPILKSFQTIEQCTLEYDSSRGSSIDPHIDDCWIWGERIVTVNVIGDSMLTMTLYQPPKCTINEDDSFYLPKTRYNLDEICQYPSVVPTIKSSTPTTPDVPKNTVVRLPMPERSLMVLYGAARYDWEHAVLREDINARRVCVAYREFTPPYLPEGKYINESRDILEKAQNFW